MGNPLKMFKKRVFCSFAGQMIDILLDKLWKKLNLF